MKIPGQFYKMMSPGEAKRDEKAATMSRALVCFLDAINWYFHRVVILACTSMNLFSDARQFW